MAGPDERVVSFRPRTIITAAVLLVAIGVVLWIVWVSRRVLIWTFVSAFLAVALNPAVGALQRRGIHRRGAAAAVVYILMLAVIAGARGAAHPDARQAGQRPRRRGARLRRRT